MALEKAGINLTIQGEAQYIAGLRNINREMDLMATNTKLAVAQLGQGASPTQKFNTQMRHMSAEIQKASTQTMILRNRNKELPNEIFKTGKSLDGLKDDYEKQVKVLESYRQKRDEVYKNNTFYSEDATKAREAFNEQQASVKELGDEIKKLEGTYNGMLDEYERMPNTMAEAQLATQQLLNEQARLRDEYLKSGGVFAGFADKLESSGEKLQKYGRHISDLGDAFMGVTIGILAGGGGALKAFMDWETALRGAMKTNDEIVDSNGNVVYSYEDLEDGLRGLSKEIPVANTELAEFAEIAGRLQVPTDEVVEFTEVVAKLGETTNLSGEEAAEQLGKFINITGASTSSTLNLANALVELGNNTAASERETLRMSTRWASTGNIIGMTDDQILALSASVISLGIRTEAGGSAVQRSFLKINDAVLEGGDTLASFAETAGMSSSEFQKAWQDDAAQALIPFLKGLHETHEAGGNVNSVLRDLGITSVNELNTLLVLAGGYDQLAGNLEMASDAYNETEESMMALNKEAELAYGTTLGKLRTAWNELKDSLIDVGEPIAEALIDMVEAADPLIKKVGELATSFSELDSTAQRDIINTVAKIALIAPALKIAGGAMSTLGDIFIVGAGLTRKAGGTITKTMLDTSGEVLAFGGAAQTAAGSKGVGGLIASLSGSAGLPWALGVAALALGGWTLWKTWGEDAYEAGERTKKWGTDVGESTDSVLTDIENVTGKFGLMQQGISVDSVSMVDDFQKIGNAINDDINNRLSITEGYLAGLPEILRNSQQEILQTYQDSLNEALEITENNSAEIETIQKRASDENRELTRDELEYIRSLQNQSLSSYLNTLELSAEEEKAIRQALTGDIADTTKEQGKQMLALLSQQEKAMGEARKVATDETHRFMKENGIDPDSKLGKQLLDDVNRYHDALVVSNQRTMQELIAMYPELEREVDLSTGRMIDRQNMTQREYEEIIARNKILLDGWAESHRDVGKAADDANSYIVDVTSRGAKAWNDVVLESGGNMDTFREKLIQSTTETTAWNDIRLQLKNADLESNAKLIIGEAAIANGWWDGMAWEDKQAVLEDNFSETVYKAIVDEGTWDNLTWEEQIAVLKNEFSDTVAQSLIDRGIWRDLTFEQKQAILTTNTPETLVQVLKDMGLWDRISPEVHKLLLDSSPAERKITSTTRKLDEYGNIRETATLDARDETRSGVEAARARINSLPTSRTTTLTTRQVTRYESYDTRSGYQPLYARGTDNHPGGMAMVNDQSGATFRELVTLPDGSSFIPSGRDVLLDLPKGSKVLRAALTKMKFPDIKQYKDGVGYSKQQTQQIMSSNNTDMSQTNGLLQTLINLIGDGQVIQMDGNEVGRTIFPRIDSTMNNNMQRSQVMNV